MVFRSWYEPKTPRMSNTAQDGVGNFLGRALVDQQHELATVGQPTQSPGMHN